MEQYDNLCQVDLMEAMRDAINNSDVEGVKYLQKEKDIIPQFSSLQDAIKKENIHIVTLILPFIDLNKWINFLTYGEIKFICQFDCLKDKVEVKADTSLEIIKYLIKYDHIDNTYDTCVQLLSNYGKFDQEKLEILLPCVKKDKLHMTILNRLMREKGLKQYFDIPNKQEDLRLTIGNMMDIFKQNDDLSSLEELECLVELYNGYL
jgi:hypothetical protein